MTKSVRLRAWQKSALEKLTSSDKRDFLAVATPGSGKTTFALTAARQHLASFPQAKLVAVVPTQHLKTQWAQAALGFDLHLEPEWAASNGELPTDMHGIITTYQQVAVNADELAKLCKGAFVIFDEIHHAGDDRSWGDSVRKAFTGAQRRISLSGTPFRSDTNSIPFISYNDDVAEPDFEYGYGQALKDNGVVRPVFFPRIDGEMEWTAPDGSYQSASFQDDIGNVKAGQRLRTALSLEGQWLPEVLSQAHRRLMEIRKTHNDAAGLVIAIDQEHARGIGALLERKFGTRVTIATSDDRMASARIAHFTRGSDPWIVAVRMVSEGVDIPRLRVGVFATNTTTDLFFRQAIGRLVRYIRGVGRQPAYMFIPDDTRLRIKAAEIAQHRRHSLKKVEKEEGDIDFDDPTQEEGEKEEKQSLFAPISAVALYDEIHDDSDDDETIDVDANGEDLTIELAPAPVLSVTTTAAGNMTRAQHKGSLRNSNSEIVRELTMLTGMTHAAVNGQLNKLTGIKRITEATVEQLEARMRHGDKWIAKLIKTPDKGAS